MFYNLYCTKDRNYTIHKVEDDDTTQTITCLFCDNIQNNVILGRQVAVEENLYKEFEKRG